MPRGSAAVRRRPGPPGRPPLGPPLGRPPSPPPPPPPEQGGWLGWLILGLALAAVLVAARLAWRPLAAMIGPSDKAPPRFVPLPSTSTQHTIVPVASLGYPPYFVSRRYALGLRPRTAAGATIVPHLVSPRCAVGLRSRLAPGVHTIEESVSHETTQARRADDSSGIRLAPQPEGPLRDRCVRERRARRDGDVAGAQKPDVGRGQGCQLGAGLG